MTPSSPGPPAPPPRPRRGRHLAIGLCISLLTLELGARLVFPVSDVPDFDRFDYPKRAQQPGPSQKASHLTLWWWSEPDGVALTRRLNLYGFHDDEWRRQPKRSTRRIAFFGDSFVEGLGTPDGATLSAAFERSLRSDGHAIEAINLGAGGFGLADYLDLMRDAVPLFAPDEVVLVLYMNDVYRVPEDPAARLAGEREFASASRWQPRALYVLQKLRAGRKLALRWNHPASPEPKPLAIERRLAADPQLVRNIDRFVDPEIAASMKAGRLNPSITNLLRRSERILPEPIELAGVLEVIRDFVHRHDSELKVVYLPSLNQVSDRYLPDQLRMSAPISAPSLTGERFQQHARDLRRTCRDLGIPFFDLTPALARAEREGEQLYWPYDAHMTERGYSVVGDQIAGWWRSSRGE